LAWPPSMIVSFVADFGRKGALTLSNDYVVYIFTNP